MKIKAKSPKPENTWFAWYPVLTTEEDGSSYFVWLELVNRDWTEFPSPFTPENAPKGMKWKASIMESTWKYQYTLYDNEI